MAATRWIAVYGGPEYETAGSLGSVCGIGDLEAVAMGNQLCNAYGLDTIGTGMTIAWAMECFERGLIGLEDTGGLDVRFGNAEVMVQLVEMMARREGFGDILAEGSWRAAKKIGRGTEKYSMTVKGQELPMHEPRIKFGLDLGYTTSPTGADHCHNIHDTGYETEAGPIQGMAPLGDFKPLPANDIGPEKVRLTKYHIDWQVLYQLRGAVHVHALQQGADAGPRAGGDGLAGVDVRADEGGRACAGYGARVQPP